ncbi:uncharacterized protein B0I36DRAFT_319074 [Microdochium trichocladiopsis]|uniref:Transmembrane protein n=1 Tax=Microdochium trichocladiopsis TaxID=1682393 RepID=A0A9P8YF29_9PEZI|nr:uncharacterized protein B0I36DRAFT_319074 [Microdochium trichocladiopsis]KAH7035786.1 hypothetical protein B0I36DRAFT_319074 [Microdochium trichocladiopsis]
MQSGIGQRGTPNQPRLHVVHFLTSSKPRKRAHILEPAHCHKSCLFLLAGRPCSPLVAAIKLLLLLLFTVSHREPLMAATYQQPASMDTAGSHTAGTSSFPPPTASFPQQPWEQTATPYRVNDVDYKTSGRPPAPGRVSSTAVPGHSAESVINATKPLEPVPMTTTPFEGTSLKSIRLAAELSLQELINARNQFPPSTTFSASGPASTVPSNAHRIRAYQDVALSDLYLLRKEMSAIAKAAEARRLRKWVFGVLIASFIPAVRKIFRRAPEDEEANDTEYAFRKSRSLLERIKDSVTPGSRAGFLATMTLFVGAILYVFQNEVTIRVAKTTSKRLKRLAAKIEGGIEVLDEDDIKILKGWRWRILMW